MRERGGRGIVVIRWIACASRELGVETLAAWCGREILYEFPSFIVFQWGVQLKAIGVTFVFSERPHAPGIHFFIMRRSSGVRVFSSIPSDRSLCIDNGELSLNTHAQQIALSSFCLFQEKTPSSLSKLKTAIVFHISLCVDTEISCKNSHTTN